MSWVLQVRSSSRSQRSSIHRPSRFSRSKYSSVALTTTGGGLNPIRRHSKAPSTNSFRMPPRRGRQLFRRLCVILFVLVDKGQDVAAVAHGVVGRTQSRQVIAAEQQFVRRGGKVKPSWRIKCALIGSLPVKVFN